MARTKKTLVARLDLAELDQVRMRAAQAGGSRRRGPTSASARQRRRNPSSAPPIVYDTVGTIAAAERRLPAHLRRFLESL